MYIRSPSANTDRDIHPNRNNRLRKKKGLCRNSYTTNCVGNNLRLEGGRLTLPKVPGTVKLRCHRKIPAGYTLKSCTVSHEPDGKWMFSLLFEYERRRRRLDHFP